MEPELPLGEMPNADTEAAPAWHATELAERERRLAAGQEAVLDWSEAKRRLRRETQERHPARAPHTRRP